MSFSLKTEFLQRNSEEFFMYLTRFLCMLTEKIFVDKLIIDTNLYSIYKAVQKRLNSGWEFLKLDFQMWYAFPKDSITDLSLTYRTVTFYCINLNVNYCVRDTWFILSC